MEHKIEIIGLNRHLVGNIVSLVIEEVLQNLFFFYLVVSLPYQTLSATNFVVTKNRSSDYLLKYKLVFSVSYLVINLTQTKSGKKCVQHLVASCQELFSKLTLGPLLESF